MVVRGNNIISGDDDGMRHPAVVCMIVPKTLSGSSTTSGAHPAHSKGDELDPISGVHLAHAEEDQRAALSGAYLCQA
ncbi:hypothetical protein NDU88_003109 [Pleurodeles waltl]|uniref:Uncharacterized protein n=1 Tax=Pleurodeles waltl TaxID=8319 RepID=A0AAV7UY26_PLEWA|nr:hypothetical protein NDU88_003109 [Pleurodeles waltl]